MLTGPDHNLTVTVEGGGVNATIIQGDVAATNGYVHIIDQVLGAPFKTVIQKLHQDPIMRTTYQLGHKSRFNERINGTQRHQYTYFVPSNAAWAQTELNLPTAYKKLFMQDYAYHVSIHRRYIWIFSCVICEMLKKMLFNFRLEISWKDI